MPLGVAEMPSPDCNVTDLPFLSVTTTPAVVSATATCVASSLTSNTTVLPLIAAVTLPVVTVMVSVAGSLETRNVPLSHLTRRSCSTNEKTALAPMRVTDLSSNDSSHMLCAPVPTCVLDSTLSFNMAATWFVLSIL